MSFHFHYNPYVPHPSQHMYQLRPSYPEVNPNQLQSSATAFIPLLQDVDKIIHAFSDSTDFAYQVMTAAQQSQTDKVRQYIREIGVTRPIEVNYNPDSIRITLINKVEDMECCKLSISLHW